MSWDLSHVPKFDIEKMLNHLDDYADSIKNGASEDEWVKTDQDLFDLLDLYRQGGNIVQVTCRGDSIMPSQAKQE